MQYKSTKFEVKQVTDNTFEGYAAYFGNVDAHGDVIEKGAFKKTLQENFDRVKVLYQHEIDEPIGKPIEMYEDDKGLYVKAFLSMTETGKDTLTLIRDGVIDEMSIGFDIIKDDYDRQTGKRIIKEVRLWEFSPVTFAANDRAKIVGVKDLNDLVYQVKNSDKMIIEKAIESLKSLMNEPGKPSTQNKNEVDVEEIKDILAAIKGSIKK